jgi:hypothetical protein
VRPDTRSNAAGEDLTDYRHKFRALAGERRTETTNAIR